MRAARITMLRIPVAIKRKHHNAVVARAERGYTSTVTKSSEWRRSVFHIAHSWFHNAMRNTIRKVGQAGRVCTSSDAQEEYKRKVCPSEGESILRT